MNDKELVIIIRNILNNLKDVNLSNHLRAETIMEALKNLKVLKEERTN